MTKLLIIMQFLLIAGGCGLALDNEDRLARGEAAFSDGDYRTAVIDAKDVLLDEPDNVRGRLLLGRASVEMADGAAAEKELRRAVELGAEFQVVEPELARALLMQGKYQQVLDEIRPDAHEGEQRLALILIRADALMGLGEPASARRQYDTVAQIAPDNFAAQLGIALSFVAEDNFGQARALLDHIITSFPEEIQGWLASGELNFRAGNFENARSNFETASRLAAEQQDLFKQSLALTGLAESQLALQEIEEARGTVRQLEGVAPDAAQTLMLVSRLAYIDEDWESARKALQLVIRNSPDYRPAQFWLGAVHLQGGNLAQAEMYLSSVLAASADNDDARRMLIETHLQMRKADEAAETLRPLMSRSEIDPRDLAMAARTAIGQNDTDAALEYMRRTVEGMPANTEIKLQYAMTLLQAGQLDELETVLGSIEVANSENDALRRDLLTILSMLKEGQLDRGLLAAQELVRTRPASPEAHNLLGSIQLNRGDLASARESFQNVLELDSGNLIAQRYLASIDESDGELKSAQNRYEEILIEQPNATWAMFALARLAARSENLGLAQDWLQKIRAMDSAAIAPRAALATIFLAGEDFANAEAVTVEALRLDSASAELYTLLGKARIGLENFDGGALAFEQALEIDPDNTAARLNLANSQRLAGKPELAQRTLVENGEANFEHMPSAVSLAMLKMDKGELDDAMQIATTLRERYPDSPVPLALEAEVHVKSGQLEEAIAAYDLALAVKIEKSHAFRAHTLKSQLSRADKNGPLKAYLAEHPTDSDIRMALAQSLQNDKAMHEAIAEYEKVVAQNPDHTVALNNLAWAYYLDGDARATEIARLAFAQRPDSGAVADTLGWILLENDRIDEAVEVLEQAVQLSNGRAEVRYHYAVGLSKQGNQDEARLILQDIVANENNFASREEAMLFLEKL